MLNGHLPRKTLLSPQKNPVISPEKPCYLPRKTLLTPQKNPVSSPVNKYFTGE
jgi:hypothetical protein